MAQAVVLPSTLSFPHNFTFGAGVSSFQAEGKLGRRETDWDLFLQKHKTIIKPGEIGPEWWNLKKAKEDIDRIAELSIQSLRLSLEWARIVPQEGKVNKEALSYYHQLIAYLRHKGITPLLCLNHFTLPSWIAKNGGWQAATIQQHFARYVRVVANEFSYVTTWITINEPEVLIGAGYLTNYFPPKKSNIFSALMARENMLLCHEEAYRILKKTIPESQVGLAFSLRWYRPDDHNSFKEKVYTKIVNYLSTLNYIEATKQSCDFIGCNFYTGYYLDIAFKHLHRTWRKDAANIPETILFGETKKPDAYVSDMGWPIVPDFFLDLLRSLHNSYGKPIIITENGIADEDDNFRSFYLLTHLTAVWKALQEGVDIRGYYYWSAIDNLEWLYGYDKRFGLIEINPVTGERTVRKSATLYKKIITSRTLSLDTVSKDYLLKNQYDSAQTVFHTLLKTQGQEKCSYCT